MKLNPSRPPVHDDEFLSALADGEADDAALQAACAVWGSDESVRERWHCYQLIGDVLRSDDLGAAPAHDEAFLRGLRQRLAAEPVVLAPARLSSFRLGGLRQVRRRWMATTAVAAGFVAVAGVTVVSRMNAVDGQGPLLASGTPGVVAQTVSATPNVAAVGLNTGEAASDAPQVADGKLIRDARLDRYFAAHRLYGADVGRSAVLQAVTSRGDR